MVDRLRPAFDRIGRADEHLKAIKRELLRYYNADKCAVRGQYEPDADGYRGTLHGVVITIGDLDSRLNTLIGELLHNARSALDHLAWQLVLHTGGKPVHDKTHFPILTRAPTTNREGKRPQLNIAGGVSPAARTLVSAAQPYQRGTAYREHPLWLLHELWNIDKHRYVIARGAHTAITLPMPVPPFLDFPRFRGHLI